MLSTHEQHNINGWHWEEKDFTKWAKEALREALTFKEAITEGIDLSVSLAEITGEAFKNVRKGKLRTSYDFKIKLTFTYSEAGKDVVTGSILVEPFCDEESDDWEFETKIDNAKTLDAAVLSAVKGNVGKSRVIPRIITWAQAYQEKTD